MVIFVVFNLLLKYLHVASPIFETGKYIFTLSILISIGPYNMNLYSAKL